MKIFLQTIVFFLLLVSEVGALIAQDCSFKIQQAESLFDQGEFQQIIQSLENCIVGESDLVLNEKVRALELVGQSYLELGESQKAKALAYNSITDIRPYYSPDTSLVTRHWEKFVKQFTSHPRFSIGVYLGGNWTFYDVGDKFSLDEVTILGEEDYTNLISYQVGVDLHYSPIAIPNFEFSLGAKLGVNRFGYSASYQNILISDPNRATLRIRIPNVATLEYTEELYWVGIPFTVKYQFVDPKVTFEKINVANRLIKRMVPYAYGGIEFDFLAYARWKDPKISYAIDRRIRDSRASSLNLLDDSEIRNATNASLILGLGTKYRLGRNFLYVDYRYNRFLSNVVNDSGRSSSDQLQFPFNFLDNDFQLNVHSLSIGFLFSSYKRVDIK